MQAYKGDYDWMLFGHDDTFFFVEGILDLLQDFDPSLPYVISGMWAPKCIFTNAVDISG